MDIADAVGLVPHILERFYPGQWAEYLPGLSAQAWILRRGTPLSLLTVLNDPPQIRITVGIATDAPLGPDLAVAVNELNRQLWFGRAYMEGNEELRRGSVLMQEIVPLDWLDRDSRPSLQGLISLIGTVTAKADEVAAEFMRQFGARPLTDADVGLLMG
jgi:hypothetical protein